MLAAAKAVHGDFRYSPWLHHQLLRVYAVLCHHMLDHYQGLACYAVIFSLTHVLLEDIRPRCLNIWNTTCTPTISDEILTGPFLPSAATGFGAMSAIHGSRTTPGRLVVLELHLLAVLAVYLALSHFAELADLLLASDPLYLGASLRSSAAFSQQPSNCAL